MGKIIDHIDDKLKVFDPIYRAEHGLGGQRDRYYDRTGVAKWREWRGVKDTLYDYERWLINVMSMVKMVASAPIPIMKGFWEYRWMGSYLGTFLFIDRLFEGYRNEELRVAHLQMHAIVVNLTKRIAYILSHDRRLGASMEKSANLLPMDETLPAFFTTGFPDLFPMPLQTLPEFIICDIDQHIEPYYIDVAESFGLPADVCSRCAAETGVALDDAFPIAGRAMIATNMPCNASEATSMFQRRRIGLPDYVASMSMIHNDEDTALPFDRKIMEETIAFIEEQYETKWNWKAFFKAAKYFNEQNTYELEKWEYMKTGYTAEVGISETLYKLFEWQSVNGTDPYFNKVDRKVMKILRKCYENKYEPFGGKTRHRAFLWGPSAVYYTDFPTWCQNAWGLAIVLNMDSTMGFNMISTDDKDKALDDLALLTTKACMRHMAVGGWDNINAVWEWAHNFNCDMVLMNDNIACKGMLGIHSLMEEQARDLGFHFIFIEHDLEDSRTVSRQNMRDCVNQYMSIVLGEEPLDPTIITFDDSEAY